MRLIRTTTAVAALIVMAASSSAQWEREMDWGAALRSNDLKGSTASCLVRPSQVYRKVNGQPIQFFLLNRNTFPIAYSVTWMVSGRSGVMARGSFSVSHSNSGENKESISQQLPANVSLKDTTMELVMTSCRKV